MYDENSFKNYIFWLQVKRVFLMIIFSIIGAFVGILLSQFLVDLLLVIDAGYKAIIITGCTLLFFALSLLLTAGTGKEVQEGYWKMAVLRKLTVISKKLDYLENLDKATPAQKSTIKQIAKEAKKVIEKEPEIEQLTIKENDEDLDNDDEDLENDDEDEEEQNNNKPTKEVKRDFAGNIVNEEE